MGSSEATLIGALFPLSGGGRMLGRTAYRGTRLAAEEINEAGGVLGGTLELQVADTRGVLETVTEARRLINEEDVAVLLGAVSSASLLSVTDLAWERRTVLMATIAAMDRATTEKFHRYIDIPHSPRA